MKKQTTDEKTICLEHGYYIHVLNQITNITYVKTGPIVFVKKDFEEVVLNITKNIHLIPNSYVIIQNPVIIDKNTGQPEVDEYGCYRQDFGETEVRKFEDYPDPFSLYPGEIDLSSKSTNNDARVYNMYIVASRDEAVRVSVKRDYVNSDGILRKAGEIYQIIGPTTYIPRKEEEFSCKLNRIVCKQHTALNLKALKKFVDRNGVSRVTGEQWLYDNVGSFFPDVSEEVVETTNAVIQTDTKAIHAIAKNDFVDAFNINRKAGTSWLITNKMSSVYLPSVNERVVKTVDSVTLTNREYLRVDTPYCYKLGTIKRGHSEIRMGEMTFFPHPNEIINKKEQIPVLTEDQSIVVMAVNDHVDPKDSNLFRKAGQRWLIKGPGEYHPNIDTQIIEKRNNLVLDQQEGVYVQNLDTGNVRAVIGQKFTLEENEVFWPKKLSSDVLFELLNRHQDKGEHYIVSYRVGDYEAVQIFNSKTNQQRVVFGPELVMLQPYEEFRVLVMSKGVPKVERMEQKLAISVGPKNFDDEIEVITSDHAVMKMTLSYYGQFQIDEKVRQDPSLLFSISDYIGIVCKIVASRIRGNISKISYNEFHLKNTAYVKSAIFGKNKDLCFSNNFVLNRADVKKIEQSDPKIQKKLQQNTAIALDHKQKAQKLKFGLEAKMTEECSKGELLVKTLKDEAAAEEKKIKYCEEQVKSEVIKLTGQEMAKASANAKSEKILADSKNQQVHCNAKTIKIEAESLINSMKLQNKKIENHTKNSDKMEIDKKKKLTDISTKKFQRQVGSLGRETIIAMAKSGPENKAKLLKSMGLEGYLVTDGKTPINLFNAAEGLIKK